MVGSKTGSAATVARRRSPRISTLSARLGDGGVHPGDRQALPDAPAVAAGGDVADQAAAVMDRLGAPAIGVDRLHHEGRQAFRGRRGTGLGDRLGADVALLAGRAEALQAGGGGRHLARRLAAPGAVALLQPELGEGEGAGADQRQAVPSAGLDQGLIERRLVLDIAVQFPAELARVGNAERPAGNATDAHLAVAHEGEGLGAEIAVAKFL